jgi:hypothetical protein
MPDLAGFLTQEVQLPQEKSFKLEHHNGRNYGTVVWRQYVLFPQRTGKLTIPSIKFEGVVLQQNRTIDPFEAFFNGGSTIVEVKKTIVAPEITIQVDELPATTQTFSGGVGEFSISSNISNNELQANDALTLKVNIKGKGNMKLFKDPVVDFPKDFEIYDPKVTDNTKVSASGSSGSKTYEYVVIPRHGGNYTIPPITFTYFNPSTKKYETVKTDTFHINVQRKESENTSVSGHINQEDIKILASDIRHIHLGKSRITDPSKAFHRSLSYYLISWCSVLSMLFVYFVRRYLSATNSNTVKSKKKKASKIASKRLKKASALLHDNRPYEFFEEVSKALFGYLSDKLNLQLSELNKDNILELLQRKNVSETCTSQIIAVLDQCEFARFAPGDPVETMDDIYNKATEAINLLETEMKR